MTAQNILPNYKIAGYVNRILVIKFNGLLKPFVLPLYANGCPTLLYTSSKGKFCNKDSQHLTLFGQTVIPDHLTLTQDLTLIAYFFKPHTLISLFGVAACELTDNPIDLNLLSSHKANSLQERLLNSGSIENMLSLIDDYILTLSENSKNVSADILYASTKIASNYSKGSLINVQKELNITERTFQRKFEKYIGISPNIYRRISQFNSAFTDLVFGNYNILSDIAFNHGYADQSHYIRAFKEFTNISPKEYLNYGTNRER